MNRTVSVSRRAGCSQPAAHRREHPFSVRHIRINGSAAQEVSENCDDSVFFLVSAEKWCYTD